MKREIISHFHPPRAGAVSARGEIDSALVKQLILRKFSCPPPGIPSASAALDATFSIFPDSSGTEEKLLMEA